MSLNFYRRVAFGLSPNEKPDKDPLNWAINQLDTIPDLLWPGTIPTEKDLRKKYGEWVYGDREVLRKKFKNDKRAYRKAKDELRIKTGERYFELNEHAIRHFQTKNSKQPVFERFWLFWGNHFAISEKDFLAEFSTGPYQREIIRPNMVKTFEEMVQSVTTSWCMIHHLDNSESFGPNSKKGMEWGETINENHARELLELHTVSPNAGYTQEDVIQLAYIMTGWAHKWDRKNLETGDIWFDQEMHQKGDKVVLGVKYKNDAKRELAKVIHDLATHPICIKFVSTKLCRHFITDEPTDEMINPVIEAWNKSSRMFDLNIPLSFEKMNYTFKLKPNNRQRQLSWILREIGHSPYRAKQPNGWSDLEVDWVSPELLLRRFWFASVELPMLVKSGNRSHDFILACLKNNFEDHENMASLIENFRFGTSDYDLGQKYGVICNLPGVLKI